MKEDRQDLTTGSIWGKMLFFSIPLVLTNFLQVLFNMADIAVIGQFARYHWGQWDPLLRL